MEVGQEIRLRREAKGWSQAKLAGEAGMGVSGVSQIETGARNPSAVTLRKLADALDVDVAEFFPKARAPLPLELEEQRGADEERREPRRVSPEELKEKIAHIKQLAEHRKHATEMIADKRIDNPLASSDVMELADEGLAHRYAEEGISDFVEAVNGGREMASSEVRRLCQIFARVLEDLRRRTAEAKVVAQTAEGETRVGEIKLTSGVEAYARDNDRQREVSE